LAHVNDQRWKFEEMVFVDKLFYTTATTTHIERENENEEKKRKKKTKEKKEEEEEINYRKSFFEEIHCSFCVYRKSFLTILRASKIFQVCKSRRKTKIFLPSDGPILLQIEKKKNYTNDFEELFKVRCYFSMN